MNKLHPIREWSEAIAAGKYDSAIDVLNQHLESGKMPEPLAEHARGLLKITREWAAHQQHTGGSKASHKHRCSFCGSEEMPAKKLIAGPGVFICSKCVDLCANLLK